MTQQMLAIWSLVPLTFLKPAWTSGSSCFMYCWSLAWRILSVILLAWVQLCNSLSILWHCLSLGLEWKLTFFQSCGHCRVFCIIKQRYYFADKGPYSQSYSFSSSHVWMWELNHKEGWTLKNLCFLTVVLEKKDFWESFGLQTNSVQNQTSQSERKSVMNIHWKNWCRNWSSNNLPTSWEDLTNWKRPWCWERLKAGEEGDDRGWDVWMASLTPWTLVWASSVRWWRTGKLSMLQSVGLQRVRHDRNWTTEQQESKS